MAGSFRPLWSPDVQQEWVRNLLQKRSDLSETQLEYTRLQMNRAFPEACVHGYSSLIEEIGGLPDPDDRHVVAAAYVGGAEYIVTENVRDFPEGALEVFELEAIKPDAFLMLLVEFDIRANGVPKNVATGLSKLRKGLRNPGKTHEELANHWYKRGLRNFAEFAWAHRHSW